MLIRMVLAGQHFADHRSAISQHKREHLVQLKGVETEHADNPPASLQAVFRWLS